MVEDEEALVIGSSHAIPITGISGYRLLKTHIYYFGRGQGENHVSSSQSSGWQAIHRMGGAGEESPTG